VTAAGRGSRVSRALDRRVARPVGTAVAVVLVLLALAVPGVVSRPDPAETWTVLWIVPIEAVVLAALLVLLSGRPRRVAAVVLGLVLGLSTVLRLVDLGFFAALARPFDLLFDWSLFGNGFEFLRGAFGPVGAVVALLAALAVAALVLVGSTWSVLRLARWAETRSYSRIRVLMVGGVAALVGALLAIPVLPGAPVTGVVLAQARGIAVRDSWHDQAVFAAEVSTDAFADTPGAELLTGLQGKDVVLVFVESYGRDAVEDPALAGPITNVLTAGSRRLEAAGFHARSGFLTSSTFGGSSWLAHGTLLAGVWVDNQQRYRTLITTQRLTLNQAFRRAGWRTVGVSPGTTGDWPEGDFYGNEAWYDSRTLGYRGPNFSWATMPDQYTMAAYQRLEHARRDRPPIMAEIQLVSSHAPWAPIPEVLDWDAVGDGSIFSSMADIDDPPSAILTRNPDQVRADYRRAIGYSLQTLLSWVETHGDDDLVLVVVGDHQPNPIVTGEAAVHDVPISLIARDPAVLGHIEDWRWSTGLVPSGRAPVWRMDTFRDRFLTAFGPESVRGRPR
jgi:hypothetical protein